MKFALWLMNRFHVDSSLTGDLTEEWAAGRSAAWLLWQTCVAILSASWAGLWHHKFRTIAAVATGLVGWQVLSIALVYPIHALGDPHFPVGVLLFFFRPILLGWIVARLQPSQPLGTALLFIATFIFVALSQSGLHLPVDYGAIAIVLWLISTTTVGGLLATRKPRGIRGILVT